MATFTLQTKLAKSADSIWFTEEFRNVLEDHLSFIKARNPVAQVLDPLKVIKYQFDFFSLLSDYNVPTYMHWVTMRLNALSSSTSDFSDLTVILIPDVTILNQILQHYNTRNRVRGT